MQEISGLQNDTIIKIPDLVQSNNNIHENEDTQDSILNIKQIPLKGDKKYNKVSFTDNTRTPADNEHRQSNYDMGNKYHQDLD